MDFEGLENTKKEYQKILFLQEIGFLRLFQTPKILVMITDN